MQRELRASVESITNLGRAGLLRFELSPIERIWRAYMTESEHSFGDPYKISFSELAWNDLWSLPRSTLLSILEKIHSLAELADESPPHRLAIISKIGGPWRSFITVDDRWVMYEVDAKARDIQILGITTEPAATNLGDDQSY